ncbi:MAG: LolA family protein [Bacteroidales bacterium]
MKKVFAIALFIMSLTGFAQESVLLQEFSKKMTAIKSASIDFDYAYENLAEKTSEQTQGKLLLMESMYQLHLGEIQLYFDGKVRYTYFSKVNEATISAPNPLEDGILANPTALFIIDQKEYLYKMRPDKTEGAITIAEFDLFPKDKKSDYTNINLKFDKQALLPRSIIIFQKDGTRIDLQIKKMDTSLKLTPQDFTFDPTQYPDIEVIDMR